MTPDQFVWWLKGFVEYENTLIDEGGNVLVGNDAKIYIITKRLKENVLF